MRNYKRNPKPCVVCGTFFTPTGQCAKYCSECRIEVLKQQQKEGQKKYSLKKGVKVGVGSGGLTGSGKENFNYKHGRSCFLKWAKERKSTLGICEDCGKDIKNATHYEWVGHHIDHNPMNNVIENLKILCKKCHQIEHECWRAFEGATTNVVRDNLTGRYKRIEAPDTEK